MALTLAALVTVSVAPSATPAVTEPPWVTSERVASMPMSRPPAAPVDFAAAFGSEAGRAVVAVTSSVVAVIVPPTVAVTTGVTSIRASDTPTAAEPALTP